MRQLILFLTVFYSSFGAAQTIDPSVVAEARAYFIRGQSAYAEERWEDCARNFEHSFRAVFAPELLYNIGLCYEKASNLSSDEDALPLMERAVAAYTRYLRELPEAQDAVQVRVSLEDLRLMISRVRSQQEAETQEDPPPLSEEIEAEDSPPYVESYLELPALVVSAPRPSFGYKLTVSGASLTVASFVAALATGLRSRGMFRDLASSCGQTSEGCSSEDISRVARLRRTSSIFYAVSGAFMAATGVGFGLEFNRESREVGAFVNLARSF